MIRIAVIGAGHWGPNLIRNFHTHIASEVAWVVDRDPQRLEHGPRALPRRAGRQPTPPTPSATPPSTPW